MVVMVSKPVEKLTPQKSDAQILQGDKNRGVLAKFAFLDELRPPPLNPPPAPSYPWSNIMLLLIRWPDTSTSAACRMFWLAR